MNTLKTAFLLTALTLSLMFIGAYFGGRNGMILAFFIAAGMNFFSYWFSDKMVLKAYGAQPLDAILGIAGVGHVAWHLSRQVAGTRTKNPRADGLDCRALFPARHRSDHRVEVGGSESRHA